MRVKGKSALENQTHLQGEGAGRQAGGSAATCLEVDRPRGVWGRSGKGAMEPEETGEDPSWPA